MDATPRPEVDEFDDDDDERRDDAPPSSHDELSADSSPEPAATPPWATMLSV